MAEGLGLLALLSIKDLLLTLGFFSFFHIIWAQIVQKDLIAIERVQIFQLLVDFALQSGTLVIDLPQLHRLFVPFFLEGLKLRGCLAGFLLDVREELEEVLSVLLEHLLGTDKTELAHFIKVGKSLNLFVFLLEEHLDEEHLSLLLDQVPPILPILRPFDRHIETSVLGDIDLVGDGGIDGKRGRLNFSLTELAKASLARRPILLPNLQLFVLLALTFLPGALLVLKREDTIVTRVRKRIRMLLEAEQGLGALGAGICAV